MLARAGFDLSGAAAASTGGTDSWYVSFAPTIAGLPVLGGQWSVTVGANGSILAASGRLADPVAVGDYPLVGVAAGVHRLEEGGQWIVYSGPVPMLAEPLGGSAPATGAAVPPNATSAPGTPAISIPGGAPAVPPTTIPCRPGESCPTAPSTTPISVAPVVVTINSVHLALAWAWPLNPSNSDAWLVPVYVFQLTGASAYPLFGNEVPVLAVVNQYVAAPPSTTPTGATTPGAAPAPNTGVTAPAPNTAGSK